MTLFVRERGVSSATTQMVLIFDVKERINSSNCKNCCSLHIQDYFFVYLLPNSLFALKNLI